MASQIVLQPSFLVSAYDLPKEVAKKVFKALRNLLNSPAQHGLRVEKLGGRASGLCSLRVDDNYRIIFRGPDPQTPMILFVGTHDTAYRFAEKLPAPEPAFRGLPSLTSEYSRRAAGPTTDSVIQFEERRLALMKEECAIAVQITDIEGLITTKKYLRLAYFLLAQKVGHTAMTFSQLEAIINDRLPPSAYKHRAWWGNESGRHVQASAWMGIGWKVAGVDMRSQSVLFEKD